MENKSINLRPLPYGMGTMTITIHNNIEYKKMVALPDGRRVRKTVHGKSQKECLARMKEVEENLGKNYVPQDKMILVDAMLSWLELTKRSKLKEQAYNRELGTIKNQIAKSKIAHFRFTTFLPLFFFICSCFLIFVQCIDIFVQKAYNIIIKRKDVIIWQNQIQVTLVFGWTAILKLLLKHCMKNLV